LYVLKLKSAINPQRSLKRMVFTEASHRSDYDWSAFQIASSSKWKT